MGARGVEADGDIILVEQKGEGGVAGVGTTTDKQTLGPKDHRVGGADRFIFFLVKNCNNVIFKDKGKPAT